VDDIRLTRRPLGGTGLTVAPLGLALFPVPAFGPVGHNLTSSDVERAYYESGINVFLVHFLMKEFCEGVRRLIRAGHRDDLVLVSEVGLPFEGSVRRGLEKHLQVLGTDHLDVWLVGWVQKRWYVRPGVWSELERLRQVGKTRAIGFSCHDRPLAAALAGELPVDVLMIRYNAAHRGAEREVFDVLAGSGARRPAVIAYTATCWGLLLRPLPKYGFQRPMSPGECYRFVLGHPMVDLVWCAARSAAELREDVEAAVAGPLDSGRLEEVRRFGDAVHAHAPGGTRWMLGSTAR
jgi:aryl-alcohol dehydrogenase-like predicted oxidoreductase